MNEATWLNKFISESKRVFNGDQTTLSTSYFGSGVEGNGIALDMPLMLMVAASNDAIEDPALKSRFDVDHLCSAKNCGFGASRATYCAAESLYRARTVPSEQALERSKLKNFRQVAALVEQQIRAELIIEADCFSETV